MIRRGAQVDSRPQDYYTCTAARIEVIRARTCEVDASGAVPFGFR